MPHQQLLAKSWAGRHSEFEEQRFLTKDMYAPTNLKEPCFILRLDESESDARVDGRSSACKMCFRLCSREGRVPPFHMEQKRNKCVIIWGTMRGVRFGYNEEAPRNRIKAGCDISDSKLTLKREHVLHHPNHNHIILACEVPTQ